MFSTMEYKICTPAGVFTFTDWVPAKFFADKHKKYVAINDNEQRDSQ